MKIVEFKEQTIIIAEDQPEYLPLPAHLHGDEEGTMTCCWELTLWERVYLLFTGKIWHQVLTFDQKLQPLKLLLDKPQMSMPEKAKESSYGLDHIQVSWINLKDHPYYADAYVSYAELNGVPLTDGELDTLNEEHPEVAQNEALLAACGG